MESNEFSLEDLTHFPLFEGIQASELEAPIRATAF